MDPLIAFGLPQGPEWIFLIALVVLLFGAKKLPELARGLGQSVGEFKRAKEEFDRELHRSTAEAEAPKPAEKPQTAALPTQSEAQPPSQQS